MSLNQVSQSLSTPTHIEVIDKLDDLMNRVEKPVNDKCEGSSKSKSVQPAKSVLKMFGVSFERVQVDKALLSSSIVLLAMLCKKDLKIYSQQLVKYDMIMVSKVHDNEYDKVLIYKLHEDEHGKHRMKANYKDRDKGRYNGNRSTVGTPQLAPELCCAYNGMVHRVVKIDEWPVEENTGIMVILVSAPGNDKSIFYQDVMKISNQPLIRVCQVTAGNSKAETKVQGLTSATTALKKGRGEMMCYRLHEDEYGKIYVKDKMSETNDVANNSMSEENHKVLIGLVGSRSNKMFYAEAILKCISHSTVLLKKTGKGELQEKTIVHISATKATSDAVTMTAEFLVGELATRSPDIQKQVEHELCLLAKIGMKNRKMIAEERAIPFMVILLGSQDSKVQGNAVTALLNLSIIDNKKILIMYAGSLDSIIHVLQWRKATEARENAASTIFSLSMVDDYKVIIGAHLKAIPASVELLGDGQIKRTLCLFILIKKMIRNKKVDLEEVAISSVISACGHVREFKELTEASSILRNSISGTGFKSYFLDLRIENTVVFGGHCFHAAYLWFGTYNCEVVDNCNICWVLRYPNLYCCAPTGEDMATKVEVMRERIQGKLVIMVADEMYIFWGISLKCLTREHPVKGHPELRRKTAAIYVFDPGRESSCHHVLIYVVINMGCSTGYLKVSKLLQGFLNRKELDNFNKIIGVITHDNVVQTTISSSKRNKVQDLLLLDVTPLLLSLETGGGIKNFLIPRNAIIPTKETVILCSWNVKINCYCEMLHSKTARLMFNNSYCKEAMSGYELRDGFSKVVLFADSCSPFLLLRAPFNDRSSRSRYSNSIMLLLVCDGCWDTEYGKVGEICCDNDNLVAVILSIAFQFPQHPLVLMIQNNPCFDPHVTSMKLSTRLREYLFISRWPLSTLAMVKKISLPGIGTFSLLVFDPGGHGRYKQVFQDSLILVDKDILRGRDCNEWAVLAYILQADLLLGLETVMATSCAGLLIKFHKPN